MFSHEDCTMETPSAADDPLRKWPREDNSVRSFFALKVGEHVGGNGVANTHSAASMSLNVLSAWTKYASTMSFENNSSSSSSSSTWSNTSLSILLLGGLLPTRLKDDDVCVSDAPGQGADEILTHLLSYRCRSTIYFCGGC